MVVAWRAVTQEDLNKVTGICTAKRKPQAFPLGWSEPTAPVFYCKNYSQMYYFSVVMIIGLIKRLSQILSILIIAYGTAAQDAEQVAQADGQTILQGPPQRAIWLQFWHFFYASLSASRSNSRERQN